MRFLSIGMIYIYTYILQFYVYVLIRYTNVSCFDIIIKKFSIYTLLYFKQYSFLINLNSFIFLLPMSFNFLLKIIEPLFWTVLVAFVANIADKIPVANHAPIAVI